MSGDSHPSAGSSSTVGDGLSHRRILVLMGAIGLAASVLTAFIISPRFGIGVFLGFVLAFVNYFWLKRSLRQIFDAARERGERPRMLVGRYFLRYLALAIVVAFIYAVGWVPITALIFGMAGFGLAVVAEGIIRLFSSTFSSKEV
jgi:small-conductance mechanosensitive channel